MCKKTNSATVYLGQRQSLRMHNTWIDF